MWKIMKRMPLMATIAAILFLFVQTGCTLYLPVVTADMVNQGIAGGDLPFIWKAGAVMIGLSVCSLTGAVLNTVISARIAYRLGSDLRADIYQKVLTFSKMEFDRFGTATLVTRNTNDVTQVQTLVEMGLKFLILAPIYLIGEIVLTWVMSPQLSWIFIVTIPFLVLASFVIYRFASPLYDRIQKLTDKLNLLFREGLMGVRVIRAFTKEQESYQKYREVNQEYTDISISAGTIMSVFVPVITFLMNMTTVVIVWLGGKYITGGTMQVGTVMAVITYAAQILMGFQMLTNIVLLLPKGQISAERITEVLELPVAVKDATFAAGKTDQRSALEFREVSFQYAGAEREVLDDISFEGHKGEMLAIVGGTGDGKTTLVNLISRLYDVTEGCIKIGGKDVRYIKQKHLRDLISYAPQKSVLFQGTIRSNLLLSRPEASDEELWHVLETACADEFVRELPLGLDAVVEKGGANFSGGQKQRLCIARTLLRKADIYIFDDSFSALDFKTDAKVRAAMKAELGDVLTIIVAQRISTIMEADQILLLDHGCLAGCGTHEELEENNEIYREMIHSQSDKEVAA